MSIAALSEMPQPLKLMHGCSVEARAFRPANVAAPNQRLQPRYIVPAAGISGHSRIMTTLV